MDIGKKSAESPAAAGTYNPKTPNFSRENLAKQGEIPRKFPI